MPKADTNSTTFAPAKRLSDRRSFMALVTSAAIVATAQRANARPADDSALVKLEQEIFEQYEAATVYDDEIIRLSEIWNTEGKRLYQEALSREVQAGVYLTAQERWEIVTDMPESREHSRLCKLQEPFFARMDVLIREMFATPAHTAEGRRAKVQVLLGVIMGDRWQGVDAETDYPELMARNLLIEFIGGEPGEMLRGQFA